MRNTLSLALLALLVATSGCASSRTTVELRESPLRLMGTFGNLHVEPSTGDLLGTEIRIMGAGQGYAATVQFAEGTASDPLVASLQFPRYQVPLGQPYVPVAPHTELITLVLPAGTGYAGTFSGTLSVGGLAGTFTFARGNLLTVSLPRLQHSFWEQ